MNKARTAAEADVGVDAPFQVGLQNRAKEEENATLYEMNAKRLLTVWGTIFNEYAYRMWQGLVGDYYYSRWEKWISAQRAILNSNHSGNVHFDPKQELGQISLAIYDTLREVEGDNTVWVMQGWLFVHQADFWRSDQINGFLRPVPQKGLIVLDLWAGVDPMWERTDGFQGAQWVLDETA